MNSKHYITIIKDDDTIFTLITENYSDRVPLAIAQALQPDEENSLLSEFVNDLKEENKELRIMSDSSERFREELHNSLKTIRKLSEQSGNPLDCLEAIKEELLKTAPLHRLGKMQRSACEG